MMESIAATVTATDTTSGGNENQETAEILNANFLEAVDDDDVDVVRECLTNGADIECRNNDGDTAAHVAIEYRLHKLFELLIVQFGANVNAINVHAENLLTTASITDDLWCLKLLIDKGATIGLDAKSLSLLHYCAANNSKVVGEYLLASKLVDVNVVDGFNLTPLHYACLNGKLEMVKLFCDAIDIDLNAIDDDGDTAFCIACRCDRNIEIVKFLIERGSDINLPNVDNISPLDRACKTDSIVVVKFLLAQPNLNRTITNANTLKYFKFHGLGFD